MLRRNRGSLPVSASITDWIVIALKQKLSLFGSYGTLLVSRLLVGCVAIVGVCAAADPPESITDAQAIPEDRVPAFLLEVPSSVADVLIADANSATLFRYFESGHGIVEKDRRYMSIGLNGVGKQRAWDRKTPLGIYFITKELDTSRLADKYGIAAFPMDYPNAWDRYNERTGSGIWLHGVDANAPKRPPRDTDGCLALPNEALSLLAGELVPQVTPIIVAREMRWSSQSDVEMLRLEFRLALEGWRESQEKGDLTQYLAHYDESFLSRGMDKGEWSAYRMGVFEARQLDAIKLDDVMLLADPEERELYVSRFNQTMLTAQGPVTTRKRLYWRRSDSEWRIVSEDAG